MYPQAQEALIGSSGKYDYNPSEDDDDEPIGAPDANDDDALLGLSPVHRAAYRARTTALHDTYLSNKLASEVEYNESLYNVCRAYEERFKSEYRAYKRTLAEEEFMSQDWAALTIRQRLAVVLHRPTLTKRGIFVAVLSTIVAVGSAISVMLETTPEFNPLIQTKNAVAFNLVEGFTTLYFTVETCLALLSHPRRLEYVKTAAFWIDVISISPLYLTFFLGTFVPNVSSIVDTLRLTRLFRIGKYVGTLRPVATLTASLKRSLSVLTGPLFFLTATCVVAASLLYYTQRGEWDEARGRYVVGDCDCEASAKGVNTTANVCHDGTTWISSGIPTTTWWGFVTITTVGFGDFVPKCAFGRVIAAVCMIISSTVMAMPIAILGENFTEEAAKQGDEEGRMKARLAALTATEHQRVMQMAAARRLHEIRPSKLVVLTRRAGLPVIGQPADLVRNLYRLLGVNPQSPPSSDHPSAFELPAVLTLAEAFVEYLRKRVPFEFVDLRSPPADVLLIIDTFFERVFAWWSRSRARRHLAHRLECANSEAAQQIVPLVSVAEYTVGIDVPGVPPPDIVLPARPPTVHAAFGPRMAVIKVVARFGALVYILSPADLFRPLVNGVAASSDVELSDRDVINFGSAEDPVLYTFARFDDFAYNQSASKAIDAQLPARVWAARHPIEEVLSGPVRAVHPAVDRNPVDNASTAGLWSPFARGQARGTAPYRDWVVEGDFADVRTMHNAATANDMQPHFLL